MEVHHLMALLAVCVSVVSDVRAVGKRLRSQLRLRRPPSFLKRERWAAVVKLRLCCCETTYGGEILISNCDSLNLPSQRMGRQKRSTNFQHEFSGQDHCNKA